MDAARTFAPCLAILIACGGGGGGGDGDADAGDDPGGGDPDAAAGPTIDGAPAGPSIVVMTYNVDHGQSSSLGEVAEVIASVDPDFVGVVDIDQDRERSGDVDQPVALGEATGLTKRFYSEIAFEGDGYTGNCLLTRHPILSSEKIALPSLGGQPRFLGVAQIEVEGVLLNVVVTHLGADPDERLMQAEAAADELADLDNVILLGDLSDVPTSEPILAVAEVLRDQWPRVNVEETGLTYPSDEPTQRIDYVFASNGIDTPLAGKVISTEASDHRPVLFTLPLPAP